MNDLIELKVTGKALTIKTLREVTETHFAPVVEDYENNTVAFLWEDEEEGEDGWEAIHSPATGWRARFKLRFIYGEWIKDEAQRLKEEKQLVIDSIDETYLHDLVMVFSYECPMAKQSDLTDELKKELEVIAYDAALKKFHKTIAEINNKNFLF